MTHLLQDRFSELMDERLRAELVTGFIFNTKYEGDPKAGAVKIPTRGEANVRVYDRAKGIAPEEGETKYITLTDFKDVAVNEVIDGYEAAAVPDNLIADRLDSAGYAGARELDKAGIGVLEKEGTEVTLAKKDVFEQVLEVSVALSKENVPAAGRFLLVNPETYAELLLDPRFIKQGDLAQNIVQKGVVGMVAGFEVYQTNDLTAKMVGGHPNWAARVREWVVPVYLADFKDDANYIGASAVQGRWIYGHKVTNPKAVVVAKAAASK